MGLELIKTLYDEVLKTDDYRERIDIERHILQCESMHRRRGMIEASVDFPALHIRAADVDHNPWLLNVDNDIIDLKNGVFREHPKEDMITKIARVVYDKNADCPLW